jgi:hypothetical protein
VIAAPRAVRGALLAAAALAAAVLVLPAVASQPKSRPTAAGNAQAKAVVLKLSDLGAGWKTTPGGAGGASELTCPGFNPNQSDLTTIGMAGKAFESGDGITTVLSRVAVFKSAAEAQASWNRIVRPGMLTCMASRFVESIAGKDTVVKITSKGRLRVPVAGRRHAAYRIVADVTVSGQTVRAYLDLILQGGGPADSAMLVTSVLQAPPRALESKLAGALARRLPK